MNKPTYRILLVGLFIFCFDYVLSQKKHKVDSLGEVPTVAIKTKSGEKYIGQIIYKDDRIVALKKARKTIDLSIKNIVSIDTIEGGYTGGFKFSNPSYTGYFLGPSGIPLKKGKMYYENTEVIVNSLNYGLTKNFSLGGGLELVSTFLGTPGLLFKTKVGFRLAKKIYVGGGGFLFGIIKKNFRIYGLGYGMVTIGSKESNLSLGTGYAFSNDTFFNPPIVIRLPIMVASGMHRISNRIVLLSENYFLTDFAFLPEIFLYLGVQGCRFLSKSKKQSFDVGVIIGGGRWLLGSAFGFPFVGYVRYLN